MGTVSKGDGNDPNRQAPKSASVASEQASGSVDSDFDGNPFLEGDDPFFPGGQRLENLESLRHLVHFSNRILLLTGDKGSGKTFLLNRLCVYEQAALKLVRILPELLQSSTSLLNQMAAALDLPAVRRNSGSELLTSIKESCEKRYVNGFRTLFVIDNAQDLSDDSLEMLLMFFGQEADSAFGLLMLAQPQILARMRNLVAKSERLPVHQIQLKNFNQEETVAYAEYYLIKFGWHKSVAITPELKERLYDVGRGIPGRINSIASAMLVGGNESPKKSFHLKPTYLFIGGIAVAMVITLSLTISQYSLIESTELHHDKRTVPLAIPAIDVPDTLGASNADEVSAVTSDGGRPKSRVGLNESDDNNILDSVGQIAKQDRPKLNFSDAAKSKQVQPDLAERKDVRRTGDAIVAEKALEPTEDPGRDEKLPNSEVQQELSANENARQAALDFGNQTKIENAEAFTEINVADSYLRSQEWINAQPNGSWTIQILGGRSEETVVKFIRDLQAGDDYFYVKSSYQGGDWYVVLSGLFSSKEQAREALGKIPVKLRNSGAWIRSLSGLRVR